MHLIPTRHRKLVFLIEFASNYFVGMLTSSIFARSWLTWRLSLKIIPSWTHNFIEYFSRSSEWGLVDTVIKFFNCPIRLYIVWSTKWFPVVEWAMPIILEIFCSLERKGPLSWGIKLLGAVEIALDYVFLWRRRFQLMSVYFLENVA